MSEDRLFPRGGYQPEGAPLDTFNPPRGGSGVPKQKAIRRLLGVAVTAVIASDGTICPILTAQTHDGKIFINAKPGGHPWMGWEEVPPVPGTEGL